MCYFTDEAIEVAIQEAVKVQTESGFSFTGRTISSSLTEIGVDEVPGWQISSYVRELFNKHASVFAGYGCYPIPDGPLLYFPFVAVSEEVKNYVGHIVSKLEGAQEATQGEAEG